MIEFVGKFTAVLDELRRKHLGAFELWLNGALGKKLGHTQARKLVDTFCQQAYKEKKHLRSVLENNAEISRHLSPAELDNLFDAHKHLGSANLFIDRVIAQYGSRR